MSKDGKKRKVLVGWADIGSHGGIFVFESGYVASRYPSLYHIYSRKITPDLRKVKIIIEEV